MAGIRVAAVVFILLAMELPATYAFARSASSPRQFMSTPSLERPQGAQRCAVVTLDESSRISMEGIEKYRERQRLKAQGAPLRVWSQSVDRDPKEYVPDKPEHEPVPPTDGQKAAANELFEKVLSSDVPADFGNGIDSLGI